MNEEAGFQINYSSPHKSFFRSHCLGTAVRYDQIIRIDKLVAFPKIKSAIGNSRNEVLNISTQTSINSLFEYERQLCKHNVKSCTMFGTGTERNSTQIYF